jgi:hypothetical protein
MGIQIIVHDGRIGRDPALVTKEGGEVLMEYESETPLDIGDTVALPNGSTAVVIGINDDIQPGLHPYPHRPDVACKRRRWRCQGTQPPLST